MARGEPMKKTTTPKITPSAETHPVHQWTNGGDRVLLLRFVNQQHRSYGEFQWPSEPGSIVTAPDWNSKPVCGGGVHAWPWGIGIGAGKDAVFTDALWQVVSAEPKDIVWFDSKKAKCREVRLEFVGSWWQALALVEKGRDAWVRFTADGNAAASGVRGNAAASGVSGIAVTSGEFSTVECGPTGIAASTADEVTWVVRPGAVFIHRWQGNGGGFKRATAERLKAVDGERITFKCGRIIKRVKPPEGDSENG